MSTKKGEVDLAFDWTDWQPSDFPGTVSFADILSFILQRREGATPMSIVSKANLFQPCFNVENLHGFAIKQFDRLTSFYGCSGPETPLARQLLYEVIASWGASDGIESFNTQELTANRRPPMLRYYYFARLCVKNYDLPVPQEEMKRAALSSYIAGLAGLCIPSSIAATSNLSPETIQAVFDEAVGLVEDKCHSSVYQSAKHLVQDNLVMVAVYGCKFSPQRLLSHSWTLPPPYTTPEILANPSKVTPYYVAMRVAHEFMARLGKAKGILYLGNDHGQSAIKSKQ